MHLLKSFATRNNLYSFEYRVFSAAVQRQAKNSDQTNHIYRELSNTPDTVLVPKLFLLAREKLISLMLTGSEIHTIQLPEAFMLPLRAEYQRMEENPDVPFPDDQIFKMTIPPEWVQIISIDTDLDSLLLDNRERPVLFYRLYFPDGLKPVLLPSASIGDKLLEYAVLKIRNYLRKGSNKDYIQQRLMSAFSSKETLLRDAMTAVLIKPFDSIREMQDGRSDFTYPFWAYLVSSIKKDLAGKGEPTPDDIASWQAAYLMDVYNNHYKGKSQRIHEKETAFHTLEMLLRKAPYVFSMQDITDFRDSQSRPLLGKYNKEELEDWLHEQTVKAEPNHLPPLLVLQSAGGPQLFIMKENLLPYVLRLLNETRGLMRASLIKEWRDLLYNFDSVEAMYEDAAFIKELNRRLPTLMPALLPVLDSGYVPLVFGELEDERSHQPDLELFFGNNRVASINVLLGLERKQLLTDVRILLPVWYTIPILSWFFRLFASAGRKRQDKKTEKRKQKSRAVSSGSGSEDKPQGGSRAMEFSMAARAAEKKLLPSEYNLDQYLQHLTSRWNTLLDPSAKANLSEDINALVRDYMRGILRNMRASAFTPERISTLASNLADRPNLLQIRNHAALEEYIKMYMIKMLKR